MKVVRRPIPEDAECWNGDPVHGRVLGLIVLDVSSSPTVPARGFFLPGSDGPERVLPGDWIVTDANGRRRVLRAAVFAREYEAAP